MSRVHFWDLASEIPRYACGAMPEQPAICFPASHRNPMAVSLFSRQANRCRSCLRVVKARMLDYAAKRQTERAP